MVICMCAHCGEKSSIKSGDPVTTKCPLFCLRCKTLENRQKMHEMNDGKCASLMCNPPPFRSVDGLKTN